MSEFVVSFTITLIALKVFGEIDWSWFVVLLPIWLTAVLVFFARCVRCYYDWSSTPEEREVARMRRHRRNFGL